MNKAILLGHLGQKPDLKHTQSGLPVCNFSLATNETWVKDGEKQQKTEWHRIVVWGKLAENCAKYLSKGQQALVEGKVTHRQWEDRDGVKRNVTEVVASSVTFIGGKIDEPEKGEDPNPFNPGYSGGFTEDDIPF